MWKKRGQGQGEKKTKNLPLPVRCGCLVNTAAFKHCECCITSGWSLMGHRQMDYISVLLNLISFSVFFFSFQTLSSTARNGHWVGRCQSWKWWVTFDISNSPPLLIRFFMLLIDLTVCGRKHVPSMFHWCCVSNETERLRCWPDISLAHSGWFLMRCVGMGTPGGLQQDARWVTVLG